eukprot:TRINITY_DN43036_c0_g1_i1.p1 TRINITY_DN43036_c0_g1~~TRINITY_DN43036_c0_g1_i1.p1  ORF type:complete len:835 (+),score=100.59 TRINITY_DN43036_c0_g1_i1:106-2610(+)
MRSLRRVLSELLSSSRAAAPRRTPHLFLPKSSLRGSPQASGTVPFAASVCQRHDEWALLQNSDGAAFDQLLREEAVAEREFFADTAEIEETLQDEAAYLLLPDGGSQSEVHGNFIYFQRYTPEGFVVFCRSPLQRDELLSGQARAPDTLGDGDTEVLLDTSLLAREAGTGFAEVTHCKVSDDHRVLAYIVDVVGNESYELRFRSLGPDSTGVDWIARFPNVRSAEFTGHNDEKEGLGVLAVRADPQTRRASSISFLSVPYQGAGVTGLVDSEKANLSVCETLLWDETDAAAYLEVFRTKDRRFVLMSSNTKDTSEVRLVHCGSPDNHVPNITPQTLLAHREGVEYFAEHRNGCLFVISNHEREDFSVYRLPFDTLGSGEENWSKLERCFDPPGDMHVTDADLLGRWLVLYGHEKAEPRICVVPVEQLQSAHVHSPARNESSFGGLIHSVPALDSSYIVDLPGRVGSVEPGVNPDPDAETIRFTFRSPLVPGSTFDLNLATGGTQLVSCQSWAPAAGVVPESFVCERVDYPARDGERVPLTIVRLKDRSSLPVLPCLLHVYGAYGSNISPDFRPEHVALLRRGWALAWAHVRGGGECGRAWHAAARQLNKAQSVLDLADAANFLLARGVASPGALCMKAASAGGLTLGAFLNSPTHASLVAGAVLEVPFVDVLTGMLDSTLPLTVHEFAEWGDPREVEHEANLRSLSPFENVGSHRYPPIYMTCARADARVPAWMPLKLAARIRARARAPGGGGYLDATSRGTSGSRGPRRRTQAAKVLQSQQSQGHVSEDPRAPVVILHCSDGGHIGAADWHGRSEEVSRQMVFLQRAIGATLE